MLQKHHYRELTKEAQDSLGSIPEGFMLYWLTRFPRLLLHTWLQMQIYKHENIFSHYFDESYNFNAQYIIQEIEINELNRYETDQRLENNHLFIKSKNYYESPKHQKYKNDEVYHNRNANASNVEDWRARPRDEEVIYEDNISPRHSPVKNVQQKDNRFRDDGKKEKRKFSREMQSPPLSSDPPALQAGSDNACAPVAAPVNKARNRRKKPEEGPIPWILPNQTGEVFTDT